MRRHLEILVLCFSLCYVGCSTKSNQVAVEPAAQTQANTNDDDYNYNYENAQNTNSNLWDTTTTNDTPAPSPTPIPTPSPTPVSSYNPPQWACLYGQGQPYPANNGSVANPPEWYQGSMPTNCFDGNWGGTFGNDMLYDSGVGSFGAMQTCYETVMAKSPQYCSAGYTADQVFQMSQMALIRCFRHILNQQMKVAQWSQPQQQTYQTNDAYMYYWLQLIAKGTY